MLSTGIPSDEIRGLTVNPSTDAGDRIFVYQSAQSHCQCPFRRHSHGITCPSLDGAPASGAADLRGKRKPGLQFEGGRLLRSYGLTMSETTIIGFAIPAARGADGSCREGSLPAFTDYRPGTPGCQCSRTDFCPRNRRAAVKEVAEQGTRDEA